MAPHVKWLDRGESIVVFCLKSGNVFGLRGAARNAWTAIIADGIKTNENSLLVSSFLHYNLLLNNRSMPRSRDLAARTRSFTASKTQLFAGALADIWSTRWRLKRYGFGHTYASLSRARLAYSIGNTNAIKLKEACDVFVTAEAFSSYSSKIHHDCLSRSIALFRCLCRTGATPIHYIGFAEYTLSAHAWVEVDGYPCLDDQAYSSTFQPIAKFPDIS